MTKVFRDRSIHDGRAPCAAPFELQATATRTRIVPPYLWFGVHSQIAFVRPRLLVDDDTRVRLERWRKAALANGLDPFVAAAVGVEVGTATANPSLEQILGRGRGLLTETRLRQFSCKREGRHEPLLDVDAMLRVKIVHTFPELQVHLLTVALRVRTVVVLDQKLATLKYEKEAVLRDALTNTALFVDHTGVRYQFITRTR